ncbi:MAG: glycosyltransferase family 4 protein [Victivallaceae bacterium]|nr:glycosyltransferase family 4 protein [Victivallaceae bacterium]
MKIALVVFRFFPYGGLERDMLRVAECAARRGHEVTVLTTKWDGALPDGIKIEFIKISAWSNHAKMREFEQKVQPRLAEFDVTAAFNRIPGCDFYFAADECYALEMPQRHGKLLCRLLPRYRTFLDQEGRIFAPDAKTRIWTIVPHQKTDYQSFYHTPDERFVELPPGIDSVFRYDETSAVRREAMRKKLHLAPTDRMILAVGTDFIRKGVDRGVLALAALPGEIKKRTHFFFAGRSNATPIVKLAQKYGVADHIHPLGTRDDVPELLLAADLAVLLSRNEAAGAFLTEAIASGCPVIASGACGFAPLVAAANGGVVPEPFDQNVCNQMIAEFLSEIDTRRSQAILYAGNVDFTRRADAAVDEMEKR